LQQTVRPLVVRSGGLLLPDSTLWSDTIVQADPLDADTSALRAFNDLVASNARVEVVVLTAFDGLTIARKT
jgi:caffeoyl-CoA O-methyltransferase